MNTLPTPRPLVVAILDGWGISFLSEGNAIAAAPTPTMDTFGRYFPSAALSAASIEVGLPWGEVGNSETGHRNIGAGSVVYQVLPTIDQAILDKSFFSNEALLGAISHAKENNSSLHIMGLASSGGVHAQLTHLLALLELCAKQNFTQNVWLHLFSDGRDAPPQAMPEYVKQIEEAMKHYKVGTIASVTGRFYAMDRNQNWDRTKATYDMLTGGERPSGASTPQEAVERGYKHGLTDETIVPTAITKAGEPIAEVKDGDAILFFNFRPDRARQLTRAFVQPDFRGFPVKKFENLYFATMAQIDPLIPAHPAYYESKSEYPLARIISEAGLKQLHIAETEKYAHITYYLNVGREEPFLNEEQVLIKSSSTKSFADEPQMGAATITDRVVQEITAGTYDVIFLNFANADMVGHTGNFDATVTACAFVDDCLKKIFDTVMAAKGAMIVTADHGNAEEKISPKTHEKETDHTSNPVPFHLMMAQLQRSTPKTDAELQQIFGTPIGVLGDVAPTILELLHLQQPPSMTGISLLSSLQ